MSQASGFGKSHTVFELASDFVVIYTCLRPDTSRGYPHRTHNAPFLCEMVHIWDYAAYFAAILNVWATQPDVSSGISPSAISESSTTVVYSYDRTLPENSMKWATDMRDHSTGMQEAFWRHVEMKAIELIPRAQKLVEEMKLSTTKESRSENDEIEERLMQLVTAEYKVAAAGKRSPPGLFSSSMRRERCGKE